MDDRADTADGSGFDVAVLLTTARDVEVDTLDVHAHADTAVAAALVVFDQEQDAAGRWLDDADRRAARERFRRALLRGRAVDVGITRLRLVMRQVKP
jgi:hypothetical protein